MPKRLSQQIIISLTIIVMLVSGISGYISLKNQERQILDAMINGADQLSRGIASATWHAMLADDRTAAYEVMQTIAANPGISRIRIFNKEGRVMFSTKAVDEKQVNKNAEACAMCHTSSLPLVNIDASSRSRIFRAADGDRQLAMVTPIYNEPSCSQAPCHAHPVTTSVLGVLDVAFDLKPLDTELNAARAAVLAVTGIQIILIGLFIVFFTRRFVDRPINQLIAGTRAVSRMELDHVVEITSSADLGELAHEFNVMSERLNKAMAELNQATQDLELKVQERTKQLEVAHQKLLQSDRLASLGQLSATVAHEINNPISGVINLAMLLDRIMKTDGIPADRIVEFRKYLGQIIDQTTRVGRIVSDLLAFSRRSKPQSKTVDLNSVIKSSLMILRHRLELGNLALELHLSDSLPPVECDGSQMQQVIINLVLNGAEACQNKGQGKISITTRQANESVILEIFDTGDGIPKEFLSKIFDPFFTTKGEVKGTGLGLSVVYGIVDAHGGDIEVASVAGEGTTFKVTLPIKKTLDQTSASAGPPGQHGVNS